jgi:hypothetical protein
LRLVEVKLRLPLQDTIEQQARKYLFATSFRPARGGRVAEFNTLVHSTCLVVDKSGFYAVDRDGMRRCNRTQPLLRFDEAAQLSHRDLRERIGIMLDEV